MRSHTPPSLEGHCPNCYLRSDNCLCQCIPKLQTKTEVVIIRHIAEGRLMSNTGRLSALCLSNCRIVEYGGEGAFDESVIPVPDSALLYPGTPGTLTQIRTPARLIVLDATFRQARRMFKRIAVLHQLPQLALNAPAIAPERLRKPPHPDGMSTIEAIAEGLALVEDMHLKYPLLDIYAQFVKRMDRQRGRIRLSRSSLASFESRGVLPHE